MGKLNFTASICYATSLCIIQLHFCDSKNFTNRKRAYIQDFSSCVCALSACNRGWGLAHSGFVRTNAMLALSGIFEFSAKDITPCKGRLFRLTKAVSGIPFTILIHTFYDLTHIFYNPYTYLLLSASHGITITAAIFPAQ